MVVGPGVGRPGCSATSGIVVAVVSPVTGRVVALEGVLDGVIAGTESVEDVVGGSIVPDEHAGRVAEWWAVLVGLPDSKLDTETVTPHGVVVQVDPAGDLEDEDAGGVIVVHRVSRRRRPSACIRVAGDRV